MILAPVHFIRVYVQIAQQLDAQDARVSRIALATQKNSRPGFLMSVPTLEITYRIVI